MNKIIIYLPVNICVSKISSLSYNCTVYCIQNTTRQSAIMFKDYCGVLQFAFPR